MSDSATSPVVITADDKGNNLVTTVFDEAKGVETKTVTFEGKVVEPVDGPKGEDDDGEGDEGEEEEEEEEEEKEEKASAELDITKHPIVATGPPMGLTVDGIPFWACTGGWFAFRMDRVRLMVQQYPPIRVEGTK